MINQKNTVINREKYIQNTLEKSHFNLIKKTLIFIKINARKPIPPKEDPVLYLDLIESHYTEKKLVNTLRKIIQKLKTKTYIENSTLNSNLLNLLTLPWVNQSYFTNLHLETLEPSVQNNLLDYFKFVEQDFVNYTLVSAEILNLTPLFSEDRTVLANKIQSLKYTTNYNLRYLRKNLGSTLDDNLVDFKAKHLFLTVQLILIQRTLKAETYSDIYFFRSLLLDFLFLSKLVT